MLEEILKKQETATKIFREFVIARCSGDEERCKELADKAFVAMLEQSLIIADGINYINDISKKYNLSEAGRERAEIVKQSLEISYNLCSRSLRRLTYYQRKYNLTNAPKE